MLAPTPPFSAPLRQENRPLWRRAHMIVEALLLVGFIGGMVAACDGGTAPATPTATLLPTATPTVSNAAAPDYIFAVTAALKRLGSAADKFSADCNEKDIRDTVCVNDLQAIHDAVANVQTTLDQHPAPPCLKAVDAILREAMTDYHDGITLIKQGAESDDIASVQAGLDMLLDGNKELAHVSVAINEAPCQISTPTSSV